jgi:hypothetical protein
MILVTVPIDVAMPHRCCECGTDDDVHLVTSWLSDDLTRWRGNLPFCTKCLAADKSRLRRGYVLFGAAALAGAAVLVALMDSGILSTKGDARAAGFTPWSAVGGVALAAFVTWKVYPRLRKRSVRMVTCDKRHGAITFGCANERFAAALAEQNAVHDRSSLPPARIT